jgi:hypothetical protein
MYILFTTIYLLQEQKLNSRNYSNQEIMVSIFVQATVHNIYMHAKFGCLDAYRFL